MKIGIMGDTHGHMDSIDKAIENMIGCEMIIHTGDNFVDGNIIHSKTGISVIAIKGNCDFEDVETEILFEVEGKSVLVCHGHRHGVKKGMSKLEKRAEDVDADIVIFGHTHVPYLDKTGKRVFINPGSTSRPRMGRGSAGILQIFKDDIRFEFFEII